MRLPVIAGAVLAISPGLLTAQDHSGHQAPAPAATAAPAPAAARDESLPPSESQAKAALEKSPRHGEFVDVTMPGGGTRSAPGSSIPSARTRRAS